MNQLVNVINAILSDEKMGKPDEIRIELARELKANNEQRNKMTSNIAKATREHEQYRTILSSEFGIARVTKNDIIRYKLWLECILLIWHATNIWKRNCPFAWNVK